MDDALQESAVSAITGSHGNGLKCSALASATMFVVASSPDSNMAVVVVVVLDKGLRLGLRRLARGT